MNLKDLYLNNLKMYYLAPAGEYYKALSTQGDNSIMFYCSGNISIIMDLRITSTAFLTIQGVLKDEEGNIIADSGVISANKTSPGHKEFSSIPVQAFKKYTLEMITTASINENPYVTCQINCEPKISNNFIFE